MTFLFGGLPMFHGKVNKNVYKILSVGSQENIGIKSNIFKVYQHNVEQNCAVIKLSISSYALSIVEIDLSGVNKDKVG